MVLASPAGAATGTSAAQADAPVLRKLKAAGVITLGYRTASPPFSYLDSTQQPIGYSIDLCDRVVERLRLQPGLADLEVRRVAVNSSTRLPMVANGVVDLECGATTNNAERQKSVAFSVTTFVAEVRLLSRSRDKIRALEDLRGKVVATTIGTTSVQYLQHANAAQGLQMRILLGLDDAEALQHVVTGRALSFAMDDILLRSSLATLPDPENWTISSQALSVEPYGIVMSRRDPTFKALVDDALTTIYRSGQGREIYARWFQQPIPPRGVNLNLPMPAALDQVLRTPTDSADPARYR